MLGSHCGIVSTKDRGPRFAALPSQVAAVVPAGAKSDGGWSAKDWLAPGVCPDSSGSVTVLTAVQDERKMAKFAQYAMAASEEALEDAGWKPTGPEDLEATVRPSAGHREPLLEELTSLRESALVPA